MLLKTETALIEAILFLEPEPVHINALAKIAGISRDAVKQVLGQLEELYTDEARGLELMRLGDSYQLSPKHDLWNHLKDRYGKQNSKRLSKAAMETLSIIAYSQPITRGEIESIRGVSSDSMIRTLSERDLITEVGKKDAPGRPTQYGTTRTFLRTFGLSTIAELPRLDEVDQARFELKKGEGS
jgi:segregation and condensation protein B